MGRPAHVKKNDQHRCGAAQAIEVNVPALTIHGHRILFDRSGACLKRPCAPWLALFAGRLVCLLHIGEALE